RTPPAALRAATSPPSGEEARPLRKLGQLFGVLFEVADYQLVDQVAQRRLLTAVSPPVGDPAAEVGGRHLVEQDRGQRDAGLDAYAQLLLAEGGPGFDALLAAFVALDPPPELLATGQDP